MKKFLLSSFILLFTMMLVGCGGNNNQKQEANNNPEQEAQSAGHNYLVLVNKQHKLPEDWEANVELVEVQNAYDETIKVEKEALEKYYELREALLEEGVDIELDSAYRSVSRQEELWAEFEEKYGIDYTRTYVAVPGYSEHHTALAIDICIIKDGVLIYENDDMMAEPEIFAKVHAKLADYGFILRYLEGKEDITGYGYEPWHLRYVGSVDVAKEIMDNGLTLEEYLGEESYLYPIAEQVCLDNGGEVTLDEEGTPICILGGRGINLADMEENPEVLPEGTKTSLDLGELVGLIETHFPKSYTFTKYNMTTDASEGEGRHVYNRMELGYLTPGYPNIVDREVLSSGIEDGMIYTIVKATLDDGKEINILYIVNPETLDFVAANIEDGDITINYQFDYSNIESLTYDDLEKIAEADFPTSSTYTQVDLATEETVTGENFYMEDSPHNLTNITPHFGTIVDQTLLSSGIEDGMIYSNFDVIFDNGTAGNVLYINDPETLNFVAATVESEGISINYQFVY